jgi:hypothetical protein
MNAYSVRSEISIDRDVQQVWRTTDEVDGYRISVGFPVTYGQTDHRVASVPAVTQVGGGGRS